jgi:Holliday junction resolvase RusA-like endonuclease
VSDTITLPWAVLVPDNARHGVLKGRILLTSKYRQALAAASTLAAFQWKGPALKVPVRVRIRLYEPDKRRRDIGNYTKLIADALTRVAFVDDSQIDELQLTRRGLDRVNPRAEIEIGPWGSP